MSQFRLNFVYINNLNLVVVTAVFLLGLEGLLEKEVEGGMGGLAFSRLMRCLSCAERERGGGTGLVLGLCGEGTRDNCMGAFVNML